MNQCLKISISFLLILFLGIGCRKPPEWPESPELLSFAYTAFNDANYKYYPPNPDGVKSAPDSIILSVNFQDGDANLGLEEKETGAPYQIFDYKRDSNGNKIKLTAGDIYNIYDFVIDTTSADPLDLDTFRITTNLFNANFLVDFIEYDILGNEIDTFSFRNPAARFKLPQSGIQNFNGRFTPLFKKDFSDNIYKGPLEGTINYTMESRNFPKGIWRFSVRIIDRDLNVSNAILSPPLTIR